MNETVTSTPVSAAIAETPPLIAEERFTDAAAAVARLQEIFGRNTAFLRQKFADMVAGRVPGGRVRATYPFVRIETDTYARLDSRLAYGFVFGPGRHSTTSSYSRPSSRPCSAWPSPTWP